MSPAFLVFNASILYNRISDIQYFHLIVNKTDLQVGPTVTGLVQDPLAV